MSSAALENSLCFTRSNSYEAGQTLKNFRQKYWRKSLPNHSYYNQNNTFERTTYKLVKQADPGSRVNAQINGNVSNTPASSVSPKTVTILKSSFKAPSNELFTNASSELTKSEECQLNSSKCKRPQNLNLSQICHEDLAVSKKLPTEERSNKLHKGPCNESSNQNITHKKSNSTTTLKTSSDDMPKLKRQVYTTDFLMTLRRNPISLEKPKDLPSIPEIILYKPVTSLTSTSLPSPHTTQSSPSLPLTPTSVLSTNRSLKRRKGGKSASSTSLKNKKNGTESLRKVINLNLNSSVKLHTSENAWKSASIVQQSNSECENKTTKDLSGKLRGLLNKLSARNFENIAEKITRLQISTEEAMITCVTVIFEKAVSEPNFSELYAALSRKFSWWVVPTSDGLMTFKDLIITRCQHEFEKDKYGDCDADLLSTPTSETCPNDKIEEDFENLKKKRSLGNIRFIGELYRQDMLQEGVIHQCIVDLLRFGQDEDRLESLCRLLNTVGRKIDFVQSKPRIDQYFKRISDILNKKQLSSRIKFMLRDIIELRGNKWTPRGLDLKSRPKQKLENERLIAMETNNLFKRSISERFDEDRNNFTFNTLPKNFSFSPKPAGKPGKIFIPQNSVPWHQSSMDFASRNFNLILNNEYGMCISSLVSPTETNIYLLGSACANPSEINTKDRQQLFGRKLPKDRMSPSMMTQEHQQRDQTYLTDPPLTHRSFSDMPLEQLERKCTDFLNEYLMVEDMEEARMFFEEMDGVHVRCCEFMVTLCLEKNLIDRLKFGELLIFILTNNYLSCQSLVESLDGILDLSEDLEIDIPKVWEYMTDMFFAVIVSNPLDVASEIFKKDSTLISKHFTKLEKLLCKVLDAIYLKKGSNEAVHFYDAIKIWNDCWNLKDSQVKDLLIIAHPCESDCKKELEKILLLEPNCSTTQELLKFEKDIIENNKMSKHDYMNLFIEVLGHKIIIPGETYSVDVLQLKFIFPYLKQLAGDAESQVQLLYATQEFVHSIDHPFGLLRSFFDVFYDEDVIAEESFDRWYDAGDDPIERAGKGIAKESVCKFFEWLHQSDDDDDEH